MSSLRRARVYRNVELPQNWLGLEPFDALAVITFGWLLCIVNRGALGWNALFVALAYVGVRIGKRGKPEGYTRTLFRFYLRRPFFSAAAPDLEVARHPFPVRPRGERHGLQPDSLRRIPRPGASKEIAT